MTYLTPVSVRLRPLPPVAPPFLTTSRGGGGHLGEGPSNAGQRTVEGPLGMRWWRLPPSPEIEKKSSSRNPRNASLSGGFMKSFMTLNIIKFADVARRVSVSRPGGPDSN